MIKRDLTKNDVNRLNKYIYLFSFLIPIFAMILIFYLKSIFPFGDRSFLRTDMYHQYAPFFSELQYKIRNGQSLFYTWNLGLGTNFWTIIAYYLSSPLNILVALFPKQYVIDFMTYLIVIKMGLCSLSMTYYLSKRFHKLNLWTSLFGIMYGMSGYLAAYSWNIMWLDTIAMFPMVILGLEQLIFNINDDKSGSRGLLYTISLAYIIISNYYIAIMICIFLVIYFIALNIIYGCKNLKMFLRRCFKFAFYSFNAGLISSVMLIPVIYAFQTTASSNVNLPKKWDNYFSILSVIARHLPYVDIENGLEHWPNIFCGTVCFILIFVYFMNNKIRIKEKITYGVLILFLISSFAINKFNFVWHGFHYPNSLPARQSFIYIFIVLFISYKAFLKIKNIKQDKLGMIWTFIFIGFLMMQHTCTATEMKMQSFYFGIVYLLIYGILIYLGISNKKHKKTVLVATIFLICVEMTTNMCVTSVTTTGRKEYLGDSKETISLVKAIRETDTDFYRFEKMKRKTKDDGAFMNFPAASIFSSSSYASGSKFFKKLGCEAAMNAYSITGSTPLVNSLFGIKYNIYSSKINYENEQDLNYVANEENTYVYENKNSLPFSFVLKNDDIEEFDLTSNNPATIQNNFTKAFSGNGNALVKQEIVENGNNVDFTVSQDGDYYVFVRDLSIKEIIVTLPKETKTFKNIDRGFFVELGYLTSGSSVNLKNKNEDATSLKCEVFRYNYKVLNRVIDYIKSFSNMNIQTIKSNKMVYDIESNVDGTLVLTMPYDKGWTIKIDGEKVESKELWNFFTSLDISKGKHRIEMNFVPCGFAIGSMLSLLGIIILLLRQCFFHIRRKRCIKS